jgi:hypothetical protein
MNIKAVSSSATVIRPLQLGTGPPLYTLHHARQSRLARLSDLDHFPKRNDDLHDRGFRPFIGRCPGAALHSNKKDNTRRKFAIAAATLGELPLNNPHAKSSSAALRRSDRTRSEARQHLRRPNPQAEAENLGPFRDCGTRVVAHRIVRDRAEYPHVWPVGGHLGAAILWGDRSARRPDHFDDNRARLPRFRHGGRALDGKRSRYRLGKDALRLYDRRFHDARRLRPHGRHRHHNHDFCAVRRISDDGVRFA